MSNPHINNPKDSLQSICLCDEFLNKGKTIFIEMSEDIFFKRYFTQIFVNVSLKQTRSRCFVSAFEYRIQYYIERWRYIKVWQRNVEEQTIDIPADQLTILRRSWHLILFISCRRVYFYLYFLLLIVFQYINICYRITGDFCAGCVILASYDIAL